VGGPSLPLALSFAGATSIEIVAQSTRPDILARWLAVLGLAISMVNFFWQFWRWRLEESRIKVRVTPQWGMSPEGLTSSCTYLEVTVTNKSKNSLSIRIVGLRMPAGLVRHRVPASLVRYRFTRRLGSRKANHQIVYGPETARDISGDGMDKPHGGDVCEILSRRHLSWTIPRSRLGAFRPNPRTLRAFVVLGDGRRRFSRRFKLDDPGDDDDD